MDVLNGFRRHVLHGKMLYYGGLKLAVISWEPMERESTKLCGMRCRAYDAVIVALLVHLRIPLAVHVLPDDPARFGASAASVVAAVDAVCSLEWTFA